VKVECLAGAIQIQNDPFAGTNPAYVIGGEALVIDFDVNQIGNIVSAPDCGQATIQFITGSGQSSLPAVMQADYAAQTLTIGPTSDFSAAGNFYMRFKYYNSENPAYFKASNVFKVVVVDGCNPPLSYTPQVSIEAPVFEAQTYTIGDAPLVYTVPAWITTPANCVDRMPAQN
jgi:hypothetical protein